MPMRKEITATDVFCLRQRILEEKTLQQIAAGLGVTRERVRQRLLKFGVSSSRTREIIVKDAAVVVPYVTGLSDLIDAPLPPQPVDAQAGQEGPMENGR